MATSPDNKTQADKLAESAAAQAWAENTKDLGLNNPFASGKGVDSFMMGITDRQTDLVGLLEQMMDKIDTPIFKSLANDMIDILGSFYLDEDALCCLIKNILIQTGLQSQLEEYSKWLTDVRRALASDDTTGADGITITEDNFELKVSETLFGRYIDSTISVIDIVLMFLILDIKDFVLPTFDFIREISKAVVGFLLISIQTILFTVRDSAIDWILQEIDDATKSKKWVKCVPYMDLISILKKYIHDYGITKKLMALINSKIGQLFNDMNKKLKDDFPKKVRETAYLKFVRSILVNIKNAVISWDFCVFL